MTDDLIAIERNLPTLADVARHANVSTATVSRCLNAPDRVVEQTRLRVMTAVRELGYSPNFSARALASKRTNTIGAIIPTMENAIFARAIQAFQESLREQGITLLVASSSYRADLEEEQIRTLAARGADGLLLIGHQRDPKLYDFLEKRGVKVLVAWVYDPDQPQLSVGFHNRDAVKPMMAKVIALGHRRIATITASQGDNDRARERVIGLRDSMAESGLDPDDLMVVETHYGIDAGGAVFATLMERPNPPTAILCGNDVLAVGAMRMARQMGMNVPQDVSITGFDDIELARLVDPPLTTVHVPHREIGYRAAGMLIAMLNGQDPGPSINLGTNLCLRGTLAAPPAA